MAQASSVTPWGTPRLAGTRRPPKPGTSTSHVPSPPRAGRQRGEQEGEGAFPPRSSAGTWASVLPSLPGSPSICPPRDGVRVAPPLWELGVVTSLHPLRSLRGAEGQQTCPGRRETSSAPSPRERSCGRGAHRGQGWAEVPKSSLHPPPSGLVTPLVPAAQAQPQRVGRVAVSTISPPPASHGPWPHFTDVETEAWRKAYCSSRQGPICRGSSPPDQRGTSLPK